MTASIFETASTIETTYQVDRENGSMRLVVLLIFAMSWVITGMLVSAVIRNEGLNLLAIIAGFLAAYGITYVVERQLKHRWRSGRRIAVDSGGVRLFKRSHLECEMLAGSAVHPLYWRFQIKKRARIPKGWWMFACGLESESSYLVAYTFMSPAQEEQFAEKERFKLLKSKKELQAETTNSTSLRLAGEERRLRAAEEYRWVSGAEMELPDFISYLDQINTQFPEWQPLS